MRNTGRDRDKKEQRRKGQDRHKDTMTREHKEGKYGPRWISTRLFFLGSKGSREKVRSESTCSVLIIGLNPRPVLFPRGPGSRLLCISTPPKPSSPTQVAPASPSTRLGLRYSLPRMPLKLTIASLYTRVDRYLPRPRHPETPYPQYHVRQPDTRDDEAQLGAARAAWPGTSTGSRGRSTSQQQRHEKRRGQRDCRCV
ncbi:hypothetical protein LZ30DRAFT_721617 [Colletotrichum cereale]|nr:hypothetical protein LZ30DRAFT_721617 [Colletotrichum cereale]